MKRWQVFRIGTASGGRVWWAFSARSNGLIFRTQRAALAYAHRDGRL